MKEKIERFSKGDFEYELPFICLSEDVIRITVEAGKVYEGSFTISSSSDGILQGEVYSSSRLLRVNNASFSGADNLIIYSFHATYLKAGEEVTGEISIVSDCGEREIPFEVQVEAPGVMTSLGKIKDLFQFSNLARTDWSEAKRVFRQEDFERIFLANEDRDRVIYYNLLKSISTSQALEEFLIAIRKKSKLQLSVDRTQVEYQVSEEEISDRLTLTKEHWGYAEIRVTTDAPFIKLLQKFLWADRFIGNTHQVAYTIDKDQLRYGNNYGHLWIKTAYQTIVVDILCKYRKEKRNLSELRLNQRLEFGMTENYLSYQQGKITAEGYVRKTEANLLRRQEYASSRVGELIRTHLAMVGGKYKLAEELLKDLEAEAAVMRRQSVLEYCAYQYLKALYYREDVILHQAVDSIRFHYLNVNSDWRILWLLLDLDLSYQKNIGDKLKDIREQFDGGCHSPVLYYEAVRIYNEDPVLLRELNDFEIQTINYGIKESILSKELALQYTYLAAKKKTYHPVIYQCLRRLYEVYEEQDILSAICSLLIKGVKKAEQFHKWFRLGVEAQLRITELYEYYMYTISFEEREPIAQPVLLYFIYNSSLSDKKKAFLYANIVTHKDNNEAIYRSYYKRMEVFAAKMLEAHIISRDLAILYKEFIHKNALTPEQAKHLPYVMYRHELACNNPNIVSVMVIHKELGMEESQNQGNTQVNLFAADAEIFLTDSFGNRYIDSIEYQVTAFLNSEDYEDGCLEYSDHPMLLLHLFDRYQNNHILSESSIALRKRVLQQEALAKEYHNNCCRTLIEYYYDSCDDGQLEYYLNLLDLRELGYTDRVRYLEIMMARSLYHKALEALGIFGYENLSVNRLLKLCSGWIKSADHQGNSLVLELCHHVFLRGKYDETILQYLVTYYEGPTREFYRLWKAARGFDLDTHMLEERLLTQMLFSEGYVEDGMVVFREYYKNVTNHLLVRAFLTYYAYHYLVHLQVLYRELFLIMKRELNYEENEICLIAWMKQNADNRKLTQSELAFIEYHMERLVKKGIILPFFTEYGRQVHLPEQLLNRSYITYITDPRKQVYIHYRHMGQGEQAYITERMPNVFLGIHVKDFLMFYHETVQYYITEEAAAKTDITESFYLQYEGETMQEDDSAFHQINLMLMAMERKDDSTLLPMMERYITREHMLDACFGQIEDGKQRRF